MNEKVIKTLEFDKIREKLHKYAFSEKAKDICLKIKPMTDVAKIETMLEETNAALLRIWKSGRPEFYGVIDPKPLLSRVRLGGSLNTVELLKIASFLETTHRIKQYNKSAGSTKDVEDYILYDCLANSFEELISGFTIANEIKRCIISEDEIASDASSGLKEVRRNISIINERIHSKLNSMISGSMKSYMQDSIITLRNDRYCVPVKQEYRGSVKGIIHDRSTTGSTLFIEPEDIVRLNNELKELRIKEKQEIDAVLMSLSSGVLEIADQIIANYKILTRLDFIFAKAAYAKEYKGIAPSFNNEKIIKLKSIRHLLLDSDKAVPIDIRVGDDFDLLVITGPNTGGKTVSLKSIGLMTIMATSGMLIPVDEDSTIYPFKEIFADIGDEQSIEQSLSTFSSHMVNIVEILKNANEDSLCLFDELGAGTDPVEGAALARSILENLHNKGIRTVATTHYSELKTYAIATERVENGGCEFNLETLSPTYRLLIGLPGKSNAFAISKKLGISDDIIENAKRHLSSEQESFEDIMANLESGRKLLEEEKAAISKYKRQIEDLKQKYEYRQEKLEKQKDAILEKAAKQADEILKNAKESVDIAIRELNNSSGDVKKLEQQRAKLREERQKNSNRTVKKPIIKKEKKNDLSNLRIGDSIRVLSMNLKGTVSSLPDSKGRIFVSLGIMRSQVSLEDIELLDDEVKSVNDRGRSSYTKSFGSKAYNIAPEIMLIGKNVDEASSVLDKYLDDAYLAGLKNARIVHGKGTGILRNFVHSRLKEKSFIKSFKLGEYGEGDAGVTIAEFID